MNALPTEPQFRLHRKLVFNSVFKTGEGYFCIAYRKVEGGSKKFVERFFHWPDESDVALDFIQENLISTHFWFCPQLFSEKARKKELVSYCAVAWADLDECPPDAVALAPSITLETSPNRFQALWIFDQPIDPYQAEDVSRRIAYKHANEGADRSGWDLTQLLRVPITYNYKYAEAPVVRMIASESMPIYRTQDFTVDLFPEVKGYKYLELPLPAQDDLPYEGKADNVLQHYRLRINPIVWQLFQQEPEGKSWSESLWRLEMSCFEAGFTREEVFTVAREAACNKYKRDGRPNEYLWKDVCRAFVKYEYQVNNVVPRDFEEEGLISDQERRDIESEDTFIERYIQWARSLGDAAPQYHQAGAFIALSSLLAGTVRLPTSFGTVIPNLWFMILADTTLTRKTTAMDIAMDLVMEIDPDCILATDGSIEGLLTSLATRPGRPSVFLRDEFTGLIEQMTKRDYMAGMPELLTKMYDGKYQKRILRKETIEVKDPVLIVFAGGIKNKTTGLLTFEHVSSGFMPRFVYITADSRERIGSLKPLARPTEHTDDNREAIRNELTEIHKHYKASLVTMSGLPNNPNQLVTTEQRQIYYADLTDDAWERYNKIEGNMVKAALEMGQPDIMTPTYDRLAKSILKAAILLSASRQRDQQVLITEQDIVRAAYYGEGWRMYAREIMNAVGKGSSEKQLDQIYLAIKRKPGVTRSVLMQNYHLSAKDADTIFSTLDQRGLVIRQKSGRTELLYPTGGLNA